MTGSDEDAARPPVLAVGGGAGAGKSTLARALAAQVPGTRVVHLDSCYHTDPARAPSVPRFDGAGRIVDRSAPQAIDPDRVTAALAEQLREDPPLVVVEGMFALALPSLDEWVRWRCYVDAPADVRLARRLLRKLDEGHDVSAVLRGHLERGHTAHELVARYPDPAAACGCQRAERETTPPSAGILHQEPRCARAEPAASLRSWTRR